MFSGSGNSVVLSGRLDVESGSEKFEMAAAKPDVPTMPDTSTDPIALATVGVRDTL